MELAAMVSPIAANHSPEKSKAASDQVKAGVWIDDLYTEEEVNIVRNSFSSLPRPHLSHYITYIT